MQLWRLEKAFKFHFERVGFEEVRGRILWDGRSTYVAAAFKFGCANMSSTVENVFSHYYSKMRKKKSPPPLKLFFGTLDTYLFSTRDKRNVDNLADALNGYKTLFSDPRKICLPPLVYVYDSKQESWMKVVESHGTWWPDDVSDDDSDVSDEESEEVFDDLVGALDD